VTAWLVRPFADAARPYARIASVAEDAIVGSLGWARAAF